MSACSPSRNTSAIMVNLTLKVKNSQKGLAILKDSQHIGHTICISTTHKYLQLCFKAMMILSVVKDYLINSTFHGLRFIAEEGRHWTERVFWLVCCLLSWTGSAILIRSSWYGFQNNAISFVVETTYLNVETSFPSVSVCEDDNMANIYKIAIERYGVDHDCNLDEMLREIAYFKGSVYYIKEFCTSEDIKCPAAEYLKIAEEVRSPCQGMFQYCSWRNETFDCCKHFLPTKTEWGICFTLSVRNEISAKLNLVSSTRLGLGSLYIELKVPSKVYMHPKSDLPYYNTITSDIIIVKAGTYKHVGIAVIDIENEAEVRQLSVSQRNCRFPDENDLTVSSVYSYSACVTQCRMREQLKRCNCTSHLMPYTDVEQHCDMSGVLCLTKHHDPMSVQKTPWGLKAGLNCPCLPGCEDAEMNTIESIVTSLSDEKKNVSAVEIAMHRLPSERYKRNVVRGRLDIVVSMGGTAGLLVGASLLSFAEFIYFFTIRLYNSHLIRRGPDTPTSRGTSTPITQVAPYKPIITPVTKEPPDYWYM